MTARSWRDGRCRVCRELVPLDDDDRARPHPDPDQPAVECDGTGRVYRGAAEAADQ